jgi:queuine tRNA-ribosyltransferase
MSLPFFSFEILHQSKKSNARVGVIKTPHGNIQTPGFVPVATNAAIKAMDSFTLEQMNLDLVFCNTYHLILHPGSTIIHQAGGLHSFMKRNKPIITDSGGFQVFSLMYGGVAQELKSKGTKHYKNSVSKILESGVTFRSYRDGSAILLTPESSVKAQKELGADIIIPLDELLPYHVDDKKLKKSFDRTHRWQERSLNEHLKNRNNQAMYAVVHGGVDLDLRYQSCHILQKLPFDGFAIGGSLGKNKDELQIVLEGTTKHLCNQFPRHLLGIGDIPSMDLVMKFGIDTFDSSYPTKCARHGTFLADENSIKIIQGRWKNVHERISPYPLVKEYSASYIHHLFKSHEPLGGMLATIHNLYFMADYMNNIREKIYNNEI